MHQHGYTFPHLLVLIGVLLALGACRREPPPSEPLDFDTDPRILRGVWWGEDEDGHTLRLVAEAGPAYNGGYEVRGAFELNGDAPIKFSGGVRVPVTGDSETLKAQTSPTCGPDVFGSSEVGGWELCGDAPEGSPPQFDVWLSDQRVAYTFTLTKQADTSELPEDNDAPITTDAVRYSAEAFGDDSVLYTVKATYTNTTHASVYLAPCGYEPSVYGLERFEGGDWRRTALGPPCPAVGGVPDTEVKPGESSTATLTIYGSRLPDTFPEFGIDLLPGVHRLVFVITSTRREGDADVVGEDDLLPLEQRVSNAFELKAP